LYRAKSLELLDESQYKSAVITLKNRGEAIEEAEDSLVAKEDGEIIVKALEVLSNGHGIGMSRLADELDVHVDFLAKIIPIPSESALGKRAELRLVK
jgi:hypothetical protein